MSTHNWLPLMEYSAKYRVSLSTLRRRIKSGELEHKLSDGKYLLRDAPASPTPNPSLQVTGSNPETIAPPSSVRSQDQSASPKVDQDQFWKATQGLLNEIKKAYSLILQEKEEQILQLKEEVADLKTLVRVLEDENLRMKNLQPKLDFDLGLEV